MLVKSDTSTSRHDSLLYFYSTSTLTNLLSDESILLLFGSRSYGSPAAPLISSVPLCFCEKCVSGLMIGQMGWDLKTLHILELRQPSHRRKPSPAAMSCQTCGSLTMFHLSKRWEAEKTLGKTTNFKCFSWISCNGSHVKVQVSADSVRYSDIPMTIFSPPITGQSSQDLCLE